MLLAQTERGDAQVDEVASLVRAVPVVRRARSALRFLINAAGQAASHSRAKVLANDNVPRRTVPLVELALDERSDLSTNQPGSQRVVPTPPPALHRVRSPRTSFSMSCAPIAVVATSIATFWTCATTRPKGPCVSSLPKDSRLKDRTHLFGHVDALDLRRWRLLEREEARVSGLGACEGARRVRRT